MRRLTCCAVVLTLLGGCGEDDQRAPEPRVVAALGDSITAGSPGWDPDPALRRELDANDPQSQWEYWAETELGDGFEFRNCGVAGDRTDAIAARLDACLAGADVAILQGGINDLVQGHPPESAAVNMRAMVDRAQEAGLPVLVANVLPVNVGYPRFVPSITRLNRLLDRLGRDEDVDVVDFFSTLEDPEGSDRMPKRWTAEGLHPSVEGYRLLGEAVAAACSTNRSCSAR